MGQQGHCLTGSALSSVQMIATLAHLPSFINRSATAETRQSRVAAGVRSSLMEKDAAANRQEKQHQHYNVR